jgi:hypothetical protein
MTELRTPSRSFGVDRYQEIAPFPGTLRRDLLRLLGRVDTFDPIVIAAFPFDPRRNLGS